ncbi:unnamed protein product [Peronospora destructor]|uniref:Uncharacterized protein n=1 Tax=Peronospora destructor TaxID=86335 RepID=A0AAV0V523_9STRA|nr:unnamed protein product [Peronospora destructor]
MASNPENVRNLTLESESPLSSSTPLSVLPPLPPIDISQSSDSLKQTSEPAVWSEARPTKCGMKITNTLSAGRVALTSINTDNNSLSSMSVVIAQKYSYQHQCFLYSGVKKSRVVEEMQSSSMHSVIHPGRTIWSISPHELSELAKDMVETKKESTETIKKLSYAEASKRCPSGSALIRAMQPKVVALEQPIRNFKKYYGLPNIPSFELQHRQNLFASCTIEASEEKAIPFDKFTGTGTEAENESQDALDNSQVFGLSATTPTFYPRQTTDTNEFIQMLKASLASKKVAPHMDWWPGDWKCTNCGKLSCCAVLVTAQ